MFFFGRSMSEQRKWCLSRNVDAPSGKNDTRDCKTHNSDSTIMDNFLRSSFISSFAARPRALQPSFWQWLGFNGTIYYSRSSLSVPRTNLIYLQFIDWTISNNFDHFQSFKRHHLLRWTFWFRSSSIESKWKCSIDFRFFISLIFVPMISVIIFSLSFHLFVCFILWSSMARVCFLACFSLGSQTTTHSNIACCDGARQLTVFFLLFFLLFDYLSLSDFISLWCDFSFVSFFFSLPIRKLVSKG